ncbi:MAG TPA: ABC transporter permease [Vicinamibacterales bacterium]|nr:ABC transporter permease [Vicinamibacterales bacterium]
MLRWCDVVLRAASPLVPFDIRQEWLREWRAEFAYSSSRAARAGRRLSIACAMRALGAVAHAAWLRWDRWRVEMIIQDIKHAWRSLARKRSFTVVVVLTLAIGIGGTAAIFGVVNAVLLRPLPYPDPDRVVRVYKTQRAQPDRVGGTVSPPDYDDWRRDNQSFTEVAGYLTNSLALTGHGEAEQIVSAAVTGGFFDVLGVPPRLGRAIATSDDPAGSRDVVVISHALWTRRFGANPSLVGQQIVLDAVPHEVIGVMPASFQFPLRSELWVPLRFSQRDLETQRGAHYIEVIGRLRPDVPLDRARQDMRAVAARLAANYPRTNRETSASVHPLREGLVGNIRQSMFVLLGAVGLVLLIVCVNVASLILLRSVGRGRELAVRVAVGAGRATLIRSLLIESLLLGIAGGAVGLVLAYWATTAIAAMDPSIGVPLLNQTRLDATVVMFTMAVAIVAALVFGTLPAWQASAVGDVVTRIREEGGSTTGDPKRQRLRSLLIVGETTLAVVLLVGAGLLARSFERLLAVDLGFSTAGVQTFGISLPDSKYAQPLQRQAFVETLLTRAAAIPNVESAGAVFGLPLTNFRFGITATSRDGVALSDEEQDQLTLQVRLVTPDYFKTMGIRVVKGRGFTSSDRMGGALVAMLNETGASRVWPKDDPLGRSLEVGTRFGLGGSRAGGVIVGIVRDVHDHGPSSRVAPTLYLPHAQWPDGSVAIVAKARNGDPSSLVQPLRAVLQELDSDVPMSAVRSMDQIAATSIAQPRLYLVLIATFATTAMLLAAIGLYGVLAYAVGQRTREIGIRLALGANRSEVTGMVMRQAGRLAFAGVALGLLGAVAASRLLRAQLFQIAPTDAYTYAAVALGLSVVALIASWIPARRAARIDPLTALRHD